MAYVRFLQARRGRGDPQESRGRSAAGGPGSEGTPRDHGELLNGLVAVLWPRVDTYVQEMVANDILPAIDKALPGKLFDGVIAIPQVTLGRETPHFSDIRVAEEENAKGRKVITLRLRLDFSSDLVVRINAAKVPLGIKGFEFHGDMTVRLWPEKSRPPFFGGYDVCFVNPPVISFDLSGVADVEVVRRAVQRSVADSINGMLVIPARIAGDLDPSDDIDDIELESPDPIGIWRFQLNGARSLIAADIALRSKNATSDPYVVVQVGQDRWVSPTVRQCLNPVWTEDNVHDFLIYDAAQQVTFEVFDEDQWPKADDLIGRAKIGSLHERVGKAQAVDEDLPLAHEKGGAKVSGGTLSFSSRWRGLRKGAAAPEGPSQLLLCARVVQAGPLPQGSLHPFKVHIACGAVEAATRASRAGDPGQITDDQRAVIRRLAGQEPSGRGLSLDEETIADVTGLTPGRVSTVLLEKDDPDRAKEQLRKACEQSASERPVWREMVRLLVPWRAEEGEEDPRAVRLEVRDGKGKAVGSAEVALAEVVRQVGGKAVPDAPLVIVPATGDSSRPALLEVSLHADWVE